MAANPTTDFLDPSRNALIEASAGTGKTWALTARILRLLLEGAPPDSILAITFTRAAAAEIRSRLMQRLAEWPSLDDSELTAQLQELQAPLSDPEILRRARELFEQVQFAERDLHISTFHSFFLDLLKQFSLEARVPVDFQVPAKEQVSEMLLQASEQVLAEAKKDPKGALADALACVMEQLGKSNALDRFFFMLKGHMLEWNAFDGGCSPEEQVERLRHDVFKLAEGPESFPNPEEDGETLKRLASLMETLGGQTRTAAATGIRAALEASPEDSEQFTDRLCAALLTQKGEFSKKLALSPTAVKKASLSDKQCEEYQQLEEYANRAKDGQDYYRRQKSFAFNVAAHTLARRFAQHYQRIKRAHRYLEYDDLLEAAHYMLAKGAQARGTLEWVQLKLGQRFRHILIDEFQDTDLMSWSAMRALLDAVQESDEPNTEFIVGDVKQSIYQWRRANPAVLEEARKCLEGPHTTSGSLDMSYRSAPAIIEFVNAWGNQVQLPNFQAHTTHRKELWGCVELLPDPEKDSEQSDSVRSLRNPLTEARENSDSLDHKDRVANMIAERLQEVLEYDVIEDGGTHRPAQYRDVMILVQRRTHVANIERALTEKQIPFARQSRQTLLQALEISDLIALLKFLLHPGDDLSLVQVLRSPLYSVSNEDLTHLKQNYPDMHSWHERLIRYESENPDDAHPLCRAVHQLQHWKAWVDHVPPHDLLDRIYHEGRILERYRSLWPGDRGRQAAHNLIRFLELTLEWNSGRYPSLTFFVHYIDSMLQGLVEGADAPDLISTGTAQQENRVQILTVHMAKGLESPIVVYVEMTGRKRSTQVGDLLIEWPASESRPTRFLMKPAQSDVDTITQAVVEREKQQKEAENLHVDYVAFTRAKQHLILYVPDRDILKQCIDHATQSVDIKPQAPSPAPDGETPGGTQLSPEELKLLRRETPESRLETPSETGPEISTERRAARGRGVAIHLLLEQMERSELSAGALAQIARRCHRHPNDAEFLKWVEEARGVRDDPKFASIFQPKRGTRVHTEVPVLSYGESMDAEEEYGRIDRLLVSDKEAWIIDFKSHAETDPEALAQEAQRYLDQMSQYVRCIQKVYPEHTIRCSLLFTHSRTLHEMPINLSD